MSNKKKFGSDKPLYLETEQSKLIQKLCELKLINDNMQCKKCIFPMKFRKRKCLDGYNWRCELCGQWNSIRKGSYFEKSRFALYTIIQLLYHFCMETPLKQVQDMLNVSHSTLVEFNQKIRFTIHKYIEGKNIMLGGNGVIVEIDESMFARVKYYCGKDL